MAAFGDSDFASNGFLGFQGNRDFLLNTVAWLAQDVDLISIRPKEPDDQQLEIAIVALKEALMFDAVEPQQAAVA